MSKQKVTFILGAGASYGTFPLVKSTEKWKNGLAGVLMNDGVALKQSGLYQGTPYHSTKEKIATALIDTGNKAKAFGNVDSYAKYLYHTYQIPQLNELKLALTYYFVRQQICKEYFHNRNEHRYLNFITSLINDDGKFPDHIKILSWNYDFLFQLAAMYYKPEKLVKAGDQNLAFPAFISYYPSYEAKTKPLEQYSLFHLNGIAGFCMDPGAQNKFCFTNIINDQLKGNIDTQITEQELLLAFHDKYIHMDNLITFAWEIQSSFRQNITTVIQTKDIIKAAIKDTEILVVIGYSFPFYNREMDNIIFETMESTINKIYFQDPEINGEFLIERYNLDEIKRPNIWNGEAPKGILIKHVETIDQFYIPVEV